MTKVKRAKRGRFVEPQRVDDLDRDELLWLIKNRISFVVTPRDLIFARWEALVEREKVAGAECIRLCKAWEAVDDAPLPGSARMPLHARKMLRVAERERAWKAYRKASRERDRLVADADAAYAALDAQPPGRR